MSAPQGRIPSVLETERVRFRRRQGVRSVLVGALSTALLGAVLVTVVVGSPGWERVHETFFDAEVGRVHVGERGQPERAMGVQLEGRRPELVADRRDQRPCPVRGEQAGGVLDVDAVEVRGGGHPCREPGVEGVVVDVADGVRQRRDDLAGPGPPDGGGGGQDGIHVVHRIQDDEP